MNNQTGAAAKPKMDYLLLAYTLLLCGIGLVMVLSASGVMAERLFGDKYYFFSKQSFYALLGVLLMAGSAYVPRDKIYALKYPALVLILVLFLLTMLTPLGVTVNGARRWLRVAGMTLQPMEFAKVALVVYLAWFFSTKQELVRTFSVGVIPPFVVTGLFCVCLMLQPDFGGAVFLAFLLFLMCLAGGTRITYWSISLFMAASAGWMLIVNSPYRSKRLLAFIDPFKDAEGYGYQLVQSLLAFGSGHIWGVGLGAGKQKLFFLPEAHNDFILAVIGEETGFVGVSIVFLLIGLLMWRAFSIAWAQEELRDRFLAYGLTMILGLGAVLNMAVVMAAAPPKGVPMPFLSYGGSSLLSSFLCVGLLLNLSRNRNGGAKAGRAKNGKKAG